MRRMAAAEAGRALSGGGLAALRNCANVQLLRAVEHSDALRARWPEPDGDQ